MKALIPLAASAAALLALFTSGCAPGTSSDNGQTTYIEPPPFPVVPIPPDPPHESY